MGANRIPRQKTTVQGEIWESLHSRIDDDEQNRDPSEANEKNVPKDQQKRGLKRDPEDNGPPIGPNNSEESSFSMQFAQRRKRTKLEKRETRKRARDEIESTRIQLQSIAKRKNNGTESLQDAQVSNLGRRSKIQQSTEAPQQELQGEGPRESPRRLTFKNQILDDPSLFVDQIETSKY